MDFTVESDTNANMLFVDGGNNVVCVGGTTAETGDTFEVLSADATTNVRIRNTNAGATGPLLIFDKSSASPANDDDVGDIRFIGKDSGGNAEQYARLLVESGNVAAGGEDAIITLNMLVNGSDTNMFTMNHVGTTFNEGGDVDLDFRVESDTNANMLIVDASTNRVGIGIAAPLQTLHVSGSIYTTGGYYITVLQGNSQLTNASTSSGSNPSYIGQGLISVTVSDAKSKENFGAVEENECLNKVVSLAEHVKKFDWIDEDWKKEKGRTVGMVAQEVYEDHSEFVHKPKNYNDEGWAIRHQEMVPTLIKAIQEQQELIKTLEARITALES
tara:strand:- start:30 stop:1016 length:987 start_codon:yes stop_codon:yes gene_type:complete